MVLYCPSVPKKITGTNNKYLAIECSEHAQSCSEAICDRGTVKLLLTPGPPPRRSLWKNQAEKVGVHKKPEEYLYVHC